MPRPRKRRCIGSTPPATFYKPQGIPLSQLRGAILPVEGFEAMRLVDAEGLSQEEAARRMEVSRPTLCRMLGEARAVVARALANGWGIRIEDVAENEPDETRHGRGHGRKEGRPGCGGRGPGCGGGQKAVMTNEPETLEES